MAKKIDLGTAGHAGHQSVEDFTFLVSPLGEDGAETPVYSPSREVTGAQGQRRGQISVEDECQGPGNPRSTSEFARNERRRGR
jgi:hypothetical protein